MEDDQMMIVLIGIVLIGIGNVFNWLKVISHGSKHCKQVPYVQGPSIHSVLCPNKILNKESNQEGSITRNYQSGQI